MTGDPQEGISHLNCETDILKVATKVINDDIFFGFGLSFIFVIQKNRVNNLFPCTTKCHPNESFF